MAFAAVTSFTAISTSIYSRSNPSFEPPKVPQLGSFRPLDRSHAASIAALNVSMGRCAVKPLNAEPKRNDLIVPSAATVVAPVVVEKVEVEVEDYEKLARELENASPLEIIDKTLENLGMILQLLSVVLKTLP